MSTPLPKSSLTFTRYLYIKEEVIAALLLALLDKREDCALFWAYELYYSGFQTDTFAFLWSVYYDFYATLNPTFEQFFLSTHKEWIKSNDPCAFASIIINLCIRPFTTDVFMLRHVVDQFVVSTDLKDPKVNEGDNDNDNDISHKIADWLAEHNYECLAQYILVECNDGTDLLSIVDETCSYFSWNGLGITKSKIITRFKKMSAHCPSESRKIVLAIIMQFYAMQSSCIKPKNIYLTMEPADCDKYKTLMDLSPSLSPSSKILPTACAFNINVSGHLGLFGFVHDAATINCYRVNWLYYASNSPYWLSAITKIGGGIQDHNLHKITFDDSIKEENFCEQYWLDPDEQPLEVQHKSIQDISAVSVREFYLKHKKHNIVSICDEYLDDFVPLHKYVV